MLGFLEKLKSRKVEVARTAASVWQRIVVDVTDGKEPDADTVLAELDRLNKSTDDLKTAVELLHQRRAWSALVEAGTLAEAAHPKIVKTIAAEVAAFAKIEEEHELRLRPMQGSERAAIFQMSEGARAKRELIVTASDPIRRATAAEADAKLRALQQERAEFDRELRGKEDRRRELLAQQYDPGITAHTERLASEIETMEKARPGFDERAKQLNAESEVALAMLLSPEAI